MILRASWWSGLPPAAGSAVMATGIISVGLHLLGHETASRAALALAVAAWLALAADFAVRLFAERSRWESEADTPPALTAVAAACVLGTRLALLDQAFLAGCLLVLGAVLWLVLLPAVVRHWGHRMPGAVFLVCVATQAVAVLSGTLAAVLPARPLRVAALVFFCLGLVLYAAALARFDVANLRTGSGDQWVAGGALAISALAGAKLVAAPLYDGAWHQALRTVTLIVLALDLAWYLVLLLAEVRWPRPRYDVRRWATVFPMGMTAVAVLSVSDAAGIPWLEGLGRVLLWIAVAVWLCVCAGAVRSALRPAAAVRSPR
ncbi:tellurite resistance/C4-dicarboxylate transporter family protein [Streptomyces sp. KL118A]|uniref:tellurite resistance/C4-dicarboxylate transporter family protein n=1 Tax=Streptomyces sp. KL118A TaxID=3045153 RepID=UPI00278BD5A0|nr:tellurite resistance/C4-dicarboxylate transporter family protein [Streptomyces sp. KL118A]